jgi:hypothetical protein
MVVKSLAAMVKRFDEAVGSNFGESIALSSERRARLSPAAPSRWRAMSAACPSSSG